MASLCCVPIRRGPRADTLSTLQCTNPPKCLYRVQHAESQAQFDKDGNLNAKLVNYLPGSQYEFRTALGRHLRWGYAKGDSYFISTFGDLYEANKWAKERNGRVRMYKIKTEILRKNGGVVFNVEDMVRKLGMDTEDVDEEGGSLRRSKSKSKRGEAKDKSRGDEYVILNRIPKEAIELLEGLDPPGEQCVDEVNESKTPSIAPQTTPRPHRAVCHERKPSTPTALPLPTSSHPPSTQAPVPSYLLRALKRQSRTLTVLENNDPNKRLACTRDYKLSLNLGNTATFEGMFDEVGKERGEERVDSVLEGG